MRESCNQRWGGKMMNTIRTLLMATAISCVASTSLAGEPTEDQPVKLVITAQMRPHFEALKRRLEADPAYAPDGILTDAQVINILAFGGWVMADAELRTTLNESSILRITKIDGAMPYDLAKSWLALNQGMVQACGDSETRTRVKIKISLNNNGEIKSLDVQGARSEQEACVRTQIEDWTLAPRVEGASEIELYVLYAVPPEMRSLIARTTRDSLAVSENEIDQGEHRYEINDNVIATVSEPTSTPLPVDLEKAGNTEPQATPSPWSVGLVFTTATSFISQQEGPEARGIQAGLAFMPLNLEVEPTYVFSPTRKLGIFWKYQVLPSRDEFRNEDAFSGPCFGGECVIGARIHTAIDESLSWNAGLGFGKTRKMVSLVVFETDERCWAGNREPGKDFCFIDTAIRDGWIFPEIGLDYTAAISHRVSLVGTARANFSMPDFALNVHLGAGTSFAF